MKRFAIIFIILAVLFFVVGYGLVVFGILGQALYNQVATIVGGLASILGLLAFVLPGIKSSDIKTIEVDALKSLAKTAEEIQSKEAELSIKQSDITRLELQKQELEFLVKKASLNLFYKDQMERSYEALERLISENKEISRIISEVQELEYKVGELDLEIEKSPNTDSILKIIEEARKHRRTSVELKTPFDPIFRALAQIIGGR